MTITLLQGDALSVLATLPAGSIQTVISSPPYYGLRRYSDDPREIGQEKTPGEYVAALVAVFRQVRRVLRDDGTIFLNLGDSYGDDKQLQGIPWQVAFALQKDGWILRSDVVWEKPNTMPESVQDRPTRSHEYVFIFSKALRVGPPARQFEHISDSDARWLALFLDTEGSLSVKRTISSKTGQTWYGAQIGFASTSRALVDATHAIIGQCAVAMRAGQNAPMYYIQLSNRKAADLLHRVYPFLIVKQRQAKALIYLQNLLADSMQDRHTKAGRLRGRTRSDVYTAKLERVWELNKSLNHFGDPDDAWIPAPKYGKWRSQPYYYDQEAIAEPATSADRQFENNRVIPYAGGTSTHKQPYSTGETGYGTKNGTRNKRSVWHISTKSYSGAHFATFPEALVEIPLLASSSAQACEHCGAAWGREIAKGETHEHPARKGATVPPRMKATAAGQGTNGSGASSLGLARDRRDLGFAPRCACVANTGSAASTVLDPFCGTGTVMRVAERFGRNAIGIELNPDYSELSDARTNGVQKELFN